MKEYADEQREEYRRKSIHRHDGLYVRFGFIAGYAWDIAETSGVETKSKGAGGLLEYAGGFSVSDHLVLALALHTFAVFSPTTTVGGEAFDEDHTNVYLVTGILLDFYPNPVGGWHAALTVGVGSADIRVRNNENTDDGFGLGIGGGYDFWIGEQWSLGLGVQLFYIGNADDEFGRHRTVIPTLALTALCH